MKEELKDETRLRLALQKENARLKDLNSEILADVKRLKGLEHVDEELEISKKAARRLRIENEGLRKEVEMLQKQ